MTDRTDRHHLRRMISVTWLELMARCSTLDQAPVDRPLEVKGGEEVLARPLRRHRWADLQSPAAAHEGMIHDELHRSVNVGCLED